IFQAVGFVRVENCPAQTVLPLVGLSADKVIRDGYISGGRTCPGGKLPGASRPPVGRTFGGQSHPRLDMYCTLKMNDIFRIAPWLRRPFRAWPF
ncbi:MAG: hypothetical protein ACQESR_20940, partial [Planctomycetota bacterium]